MAASCGGGLGCLRDVLDDLSGQQQRLKATVAEMEAVIRKRREDAEELIDSIAGHALAKLKVIATNVQVQKTHSDQYSRVPKHGGSLSLFDPIIGLAELGRHFIEAKKQI
jgi:hypothetical protein